jgi:hypothetical protein
VKAIFRKGRRLSRSLDQQNLRYKGQKWKRRHALRKKSLKSKESATFGRVPDFPPQKAGPGALAAAALS